MSRKPPPPPEPPTIPITCSLCGALIHEVRLELPMPVEDFARLIERIRPWHECPMGEGWEAVVGKAKK